MYIFKKIVGFYNELINSKWVYFLISFSILLSYYLLYIFRSLDHTVLMGWYFVFMLRDINMFELFLILSIVILASFLISKVNIKNRYNNEKYHILCLFFSGFIIGSLFWNIPEINPDAIRYITEAKYLDEYGIFRFFNDWGNELFVFIDFPSIPLFYGIIFRYLGEYREYIQLFNTILFSLTSVLVYKISKRLWNEEIGLYSGFLLLSFPYLLSQVPLILIDIPLMFFTVLSAFLIFKVFDNKYYSIPASLAIFFTLYAKMTGFLMIIPAISILIINYKSITKNSFRWILTIFLSLTLVILFFLWKKDIFINQILYTVTFPSDINPYSEGVLKYLFQIGSIVILFAILSIIISYRNKYKNYILLISWIIIPFFMLNVRLRYLIPVFPFIAVMASLSIGSLANKEVKRFLVLSLVLTSFVFTIYSYIPFEEEFTDANVKNAAEFTNSLNLSEIQLFMDFSEKHRYTPEPFVPLFDLYSQKKIIYYRNNTFYPVKDYSNTYTALYRLPSFYYANGSSNSPRTDQIIVIISDKKESNSIPSKYLENHFLTKEFNKTTFGVFIPSSVKVYIPKNY